MKVGVEIGGTFTDLVCIDEKGVRLAKVPSTPREPDRGVFDAIAAGRVELRWIPSATALADNAAKTPHLRRYLVEADWAPVRDLALQLATRHLRLESVQRRGHFTVYAITAQPPAAAANWRVCAPSAPWPVWAGARGEGRGAPTSQFTIDHSPFTIPTARGEGRHD